MAEVPPSYQNPSGGGGKAIFFIVGILLGALALLTLFYFFGQQCCGTQQTTGVSQGGDTTIIRDSGGNIITYNPRDQGTRTTYTDPSGGQRDVLCYESLYCVEECPGCTNETCGQECVPDGSYCGYGTVSRTTITRLTDSSTFYGDCCEGYGCVNGYCRRGECVGNDGLCGYGPTSNTLVANNPAYYGECCEGYQCMDGYCTPPTQEECVAEGVSCGYGTTSVTALIPDTSSYYGRCCGDFACLDGTCQRRTECTDRGSFCGYGPRTFTNDYQSPTYYGECCGDYQCVNGYCTPPGQTCIQTGGTCGYGTTYTTVAPPPGASYYGTCCQGDYCYNGICTPERGCSPQGGTCAAGQIECCEGYTCTSGICATPCTLKGASCTYDSECCEGTWCSDGSCSDACVSAVGASCVPGRKDCCEGMTCTDGLCNLECKRSGSCSSASDCCDGYYCSDNDYCSVAPSTCYDSDQANYYNAGYAVGYLDGTFGTYYDYCEEDYRVIEYTCAASANQVMATPYTCAYKCADGACPQYYQ